MRVTLLCVVFLGLLVLRVLGQLNNFGDRRPAERNRNFNRNLNRNGGVAREFPNNNLNPTQNAEWLNNPTQFGPVPACVAPQGQCGPIQLTQRECCRGFCRRGICP